MIWKDGVCIAETEDTVQVKRQDGHLNLAISTLSSHETFCDFNADAQAISEDKIRASAPGEKFDYSIDDFVDVTCEVTVTYKTPDSIDVFTNGKCESFCGVGASMEIEGAKRK
jgi:hypothetical protein